MPELGALEAGQAVSLAGLAPIARQSGPDAPSSGEAEPRSAKPSTCQPSSRPALEPVDLQLLGLRLTVSGKRQLRIRAKFLHPFAKNVLVDVDVSRPLLHAYASLPLQADRLDLELSTELSPLRPAPPAS